MVLIVILIGRQVVYRESLQDVIDKASNLQQQMQEGKRKVSLIINCTTIFFSLSISSDVKEKKRSKGFIATIKDIVDRSNK